jgi:hypothetical protein
MLQMLLVFKKIFILAHFEKGSAQSDLMRIKCSQSLDSNANILLVSPYQN